MREKSRIAVCAVLCVFAFAVLNGCSTVPKMPIKLDPNFASKGIDTIVLMPIVDRRIDKKCKVDFEKTLRMPAKKILARKGYNVIMPAAFNDGGTITADNVGEMNVSELSNLGPANERAILVIYVDDVLDEYVVVAYSYKIEATGSLIEKKERVELWRDKGIGKSGQGGLISGPLSFVYQCEANDMCLNDMLCTLPKNPAAVNSRGRRGAVEQVSAATTPPPAPVAAVVTAPAAAK